VALIYKIFDESMMLGRRGAVWAVVELVDIENVHGSRVLLEILCEKCSVREVTQRSI